jgi:hypothetical protein
MQFRPVDLSELVGTILGLSVALVPVIGFTLRFALKPLVEAYARARSPQYAEVHQLTARVELLERQLAELRAGSFSSSLTEVPLSTPMPELPLPGRTSIRGGV